MYLQPDSAVEQTDEADVDSTSRALNVQTKRTPHGGKSNGEPLVPSV